LKRYREIVRKDDRPEDDIVCIYFKTGHLFPCDREAETIFGYPIFDVDQLADLLRRHSPDNAIFSDYRDYIRESITERDEALDKYRQGDFEQFKKDFVQLCFVEDLQAKTKGHLPDTRIYHGTNMGGTPWTQLHLIYREDAYGQDTTCESLFLRLDRKKNRATGEAGFYLSLRQYAESRKRGEKYELTPEQQTEKSRRREALMGIFKDVRSGFPLEFAQVHNRGVYESEVAILFFDLERNTPQKVLEHMPKLVCAFMERVKPEGLF
jgi:hypothetical protein